MFVLAALGRSAFELPECRHQESRLAHETFGSAIGGRTGLEHAKRSPLEIVDAVLAPPQLVVEPENLGDETGAEMKWWLCALCTRRATRHAEKNFALGRCEHRSEVAEAFARTEARVREA